MQESIAFLDMSNAHAHKLCERVQQNADKYIIPLSLRCLRTFFHVHFEYCAMMYRYVYFVNIHTESKPNRTETEKIQ